MSADTPHGTTPEHGFRGKGDFEGHFRNSSREAERLGKVSEIGSKIPFSPTTVAPGATAPRDKPFMVRVLRFDPKSRRGDAPVKYLLPLWDDEQVDRFTTAHTDETFILRDDLHGVDLLCVRQGPLSAGVGARLARSGETDADRVWRERRTR